MPYDDYTRQTPGRYVPPDIDTGISLFDEPAPPRYQGECDQRVAASIASGASHTMHPRNWDLFSYPTGQWGEPSWGPRRGPFAQSVTAEGFQGAPWVAPAGRFPVTREHPDGGLNPAMWPSPGASTMYAPPDPRPMYYGPPTPAGGMPSHYQPIHPPTRTAHKKHADAFAAGPRCASCASINIAVTPSTVIIFILFILLTCMLSAHAGPYGAPHSARAYAAPYGAPQAAS